MSSCFISGRGGNGSVKLKVSRPVFSSPWPGQVGYEGMTSSGEGTGLSGSDSDWLASCSSRGASTAWWRESSLNQGWFKHCSTVARFLERGEKKDCSTFCDFFFFFVRCAILCSIFYIRLYNIHLRTGHSRVLMSHILILAHEMMILQQNYTAKIK